MKEFNVIVTKDKSEGGIHVSVQPKPTCTNDAYLPMVSRAFQELVVRHSEKKNTYALRRKIKKEFIELLEKYRKQGIIEFDSSRKMEFEEKEESIQQDLTNSTK